MLTDMDITIMEGCLERLRRCEPVLRAAAELTTEFPWTNYREPSPTEPYRDCYEWLLSTLKKRLSQESWRELALRRDTLRAVIEVQDVIADIERLVSDTDNG